MPTRRKLILLGVVVLGAVSGGACVAPAGATTAWRWPAHGPVTDPFHYREATPFLSGQRRGIVIAAPAGAAVWAACAGRVSFAGRLGPTGGRGATVVCGALTATYLRLGDVTIRRGERVDAGERIGSVGPRGVHLGARVTGRRWAYVDPLSLLRGDPGPTRIPVAPAPRRRPGVPWALGPAPVRERVPRWSPVLRPPVLRPVGSLGHADVPLVAWLGLGLLAAALPAVGLTRRRRRRRAPAAAAAGEIARAG